MTVYMSWMPANIMGTVLQAQLYPHLHLLNGNKAKDLQDIATHQLGRQDDVTRAHHVVSSQTSTLD